MTWHLVVELQGHVTVTKNTSRENVVSNSTEEEKNSHGNDCSKSTVFSCRLNISNDGCDVSVAGKLFHTRAPATAKARSPRVRRRVVGTSKADDEPERSLHRDSTSAARLKASAR